MRQSGKLERAVEELRRDPRLWRVAEIGEKYLRRLWWRRVPETPCRRCGSYGHFTHSHPKERARGIEAVRDRLDDAENAFGALTDVQELRLMSDARRLLMVAQAAEDLQRELVGWNAPDRQAAFHLDDLRAKLRELDEATA